jgi:hypothetical protein
MRLASAACLAATTVRPIRSAISKRPSTTDIIAIDGGHASAPDRVRVACWAGNIDGAASSSTAPGLTTKNAVADQRLRRAA